MSAFPNPVDKKIANELNEVFEELEREDIRAMAEPEGTIEALPYGEEGRKVVRNRIPEITIVKTIQEIPDLVAEMDDLSEWFPGISPQLPFVNISISSSVHSNPLYVEKNGVELPPEGVIHEDTPFPLEYHIVESDEESVEKIDIPDKLNVYHTENFNVGWFCTEFFPEIYEEFKNIGDKELLDFYNLNPYIETWGDRVFHFDQVLRAYRQDQTGLLIVLLSVFFESHIELKLRDFLSEYQEHPHASSVVDDLNFDGMLNACRYFGLIEDDDFNIINKVKNSRNDYAHDMNAFRTSQQTQLEEEGLVDSAIELYEDLIEVQGSIVE